MELKGAKYIVDGMPVEINCEDMENKIQKDEETWRGQGLQPAYGEIGKSDFSKAHISGGCSMERP